MQQLWWCPVPYLQKWVYGRHRNSDDENLNYWIFSDLTLSQGDPFDANKVFSWDIGNTRYFANCLGGDQVHENPEEFKTGSGFTCNVLFYF